MKQDLDCRDIAEGAQGLPHGRGVGKRVGWINIQVNTLPTIMYADGLNERHLLSRFVRNNLYKEW
ncbi:MAG: hypothetical protein AAGB03_01385 [Pseudomonadota bacterium]